LFSSRTHTSQFSVILYMLINIYYLLFNNFKELDFRLHKMYKKVLFFFPSYLSFFFLFFFICFWRTHGHLFTHSSILSWFLQRHIFSLAHPSKTTIVRLRITSRANNLAVAVHRITVFLRITYTRLITFSTKSDLECAAHV